MSIFKGSGVALITPFNEDGDVDYISLSKLIDFHLNNKTDAIIICATTGEAPTLSDEEHLSVINYSVKKVNKKIPLLAGTGSNDTKHAIMMSKDAQKLGADGLLIVTPYYNKTTQKGLEAHYNAIAQSVDIPILMYNVPSRTGVNINPETAINIFKKNSNIVGIKEASGKIDIMQKMCQLAHENGITFDLYSGNDNDVLDALKLGGKGVISVCANIVPEKVHDMIYSYFDDDLIKSVEYQEDIKELSDVLFSEVNPIPIKEACYKMNLINSNKLRLPLVNMEEENKKKLVKKKKKQGLI